MGPNDVLGVVSEFSFEQFGVFAACGNGILNTTPIRLGFERLQLRDRGGEAMPLSLWT